MAKPNFVLIGGDLVIPILYEDRAVMALDKPAGWMLAPNSWDRTGRNLQLAIESAICAGDFWAASRNLRFLRYVHRLDADTSGITLFAKNLKAVPLYSELFESRQVEKVYLAVIQGRPAKTEWTCALALGPDPRRQGTMKPDAREGKEAETRFRVVRSVGERTLIEAHPLTGRTHQIRVHLAASGYPVLNDPLYGPWSDTDPRGPSGEREPRPTRVDGLALRAVYMQYPDPFQKRTIHIEAPSQEFLSRYGLSQPPPAPANPNAPTDYRSTTSISTISDGNRAKTGIKVKGHSPGSSPKRPGS